MNPYKCHQIVEYIRMQSEFPFDGLDVEEDVDRVIGYYGFHPKLSDVTRRILIAELLPLGIGRELGEVSRLVEDIPMGCL
jgi:hypothetical protein